MNIHTKTLKSGLRLQAVEIPGSRAITTMILVGAGSRYETWEITGISHFLEHMFFKGAKKFKSPKEVSEAVDSFGGEFNAFTGKEYAGYYVKSNRENLKKSLEVLSDMLLESTFPEHEIEKERGVILEEMAMYQDAPMYQISWDFERLVFGNQPLGWDQIGTKDLVKSVTRQQFLDYKAALYVPENMVITIAGNVTAKDLETVNLYFQAANGTQSIHPHKYNASITTQKTKLRVKRTEQYHLAFGCLGIAETDDRFPAFKILAAILGGNMSSRMFQNVREDKGLCYSIRTYVDDFSDTGLLVTRAGVKVTDTLKAVEAIRYEYDQVRESGITEAELEKAKNYLCGKVDLGTEDCEDVAHEYGKMALMYNHLESFDEYKERLQAVDLKTVNQLAADLLKSKNLRFAGIGPQINEEELNKLIN